MTKRPGPKPKPLTLVAGHRTEAERRDREERTVRPHPVAPRRPAGLSVFERECWDQHAPELDRLGLLTVLDAGGFRQLCAAYGLAMEALRSMRPRKADGSIDGRRRSFEVVVPDRKYGGVKRHPAFGLYVLAAKEYRAWCSEFGLTPSSRVGLRPGAPIGSVEDDEDDDAEFFGS